MSERTRTSFTAWKLYLLLIVPATILLNLWFVNFHAPDDYDHVKRASTLFHEPLRIVTPRAKSSGAMIDDGLAEYIQSQTPIAKFQRPLTEESRAAYEKNHIVRWTGNQTFSEMPGALNYFPLLYAPQAAMLELGRVSGASVQQSVLWARFANGFVGIALAAVGLCLLPSGQALALFMLLLPRTLMQFASNSADPILYGLALIIVSLGVRVRRHDQLESGLVAAAIFISASVRPPMAALALPPALQAARERQWFSLALLLGACAAAILWFVSVVPWITDLRCGRLGSLGPQIGTFALEWPLLISRTFLARGAYYYASFVGNYGWGNGPAGTNGIAMPMWIYVTALPLFAIALRQDLLTRAEMPPMLRLGLAASAAGVMWLTFLSMYVACTATDATIIGGVQGRYFVPALFALAPAIGGLAAGRTANWPNLYQILLVGWVANCTMTMLINASQLYPNLP